MLRNEKDHFTVGENKQTNSEINYGHHEGAVERQNIGDSAESNYQVQQNNIQVGSNDLRKPS